METNKQNPADCRWFFSSWVLSRFIISAVDKTIERTIRGINGHVSIFLVSLILRALWSLFLPDISLVLSFPWGTPLAFPESPSCTYFTACPTDIYGYTTNSLKPKLSLCYLGIPVVLCAYRLFIKYLFDYHVEKSLRSFYLAVSGMKRRERIFPLFVSEIPVLLFTGR